MPEAEADQQHKPQEPTAPEAQMKQVRHQSHQTTSYPCGARNSPMPSSSEQRIDHMSTVELSDRQQINRGNQQANPSSQRNRMNIDVYAVWINAQHHSRNPPK